MSTLVRPSTPVIEQWLVDKLARELDLPLDAIDVHEPFANLGLGSLQAIRLAGALEEWLGRPLPATLVWDYPNVVTLARQLSEGGDFANVSDDEDW